MEMNSVPIVTINVGHMQELSTLAGFDHEKEVAEEVRTASHSHMRTYVERVGQKNLAPTTT
jgi:hypothetical protein